MLTHAPHESRWLLSYTGTGSKSYNYYLLYCTYITSLACTAVGKMKIPCNYHHNPYICLHISRHFKSYLDLSKQA